MTLLRRGTAFSHAVLMIASALPAGAQIAAPILPEKTAGATPAAKISTAGALKEELKWLQAERVTVSTASLRAEAVETAPATVRVLTERQIRERGYHSLEDVLKDLPGVDVLDHVEIEAKTRIT